MTVLTAGPDQELPNPGRHLNPERGIMTIPTDLGPELPNPERGIMMTVLKDPPDLPGQNLGQRMMVLKVQFPDLPNRNPPPHRVCLPMKKSA